VRAAAARRGGGPRSARAAPQGSRRAAAAAEAPFSASLLRGAAADHHPARCSHRHHIGRSAHGHRCRRQASGHSKRTGQGHHEELQKVQSEERDLPIANLAVWPADELIIRSCRSVELAPKQRDSPESSPVGSLGAPPPHDQARPPVRRARPARTPAGPSLPAPPKAAAPNTHSNREQRAAPCRASGREETDPPPQAHHSCCAQGSPCASSRALSRYARPCRRRQRRTAALTLTRVARLALKCVPTWRRRPAPLHFHPTAPSDTCNPWLCRTCSASSPPSAPRAAATRART
jgi:hypothetical protein